MGDISPSSSGVSILALLVLRRRRRKDISDDVAEISREATTILNGHKGNYVPVYAYHSAHKEEGLRGASKRRQTEILKKKRRSRNLETFLDDLGV